MEPILEILRPDGSTERHMLGAEQVILGRHPRSGIAIPSAYELEAEHMMIMPRREGCWISVAEGARTPATVAGQHFVSGMLPWGSELGVGSLLLRVMEAPPQVAAPKQSQVSLPTVLLSVALLGVAAWLFLRPADDRLPGMTSAPPPPLFSDKAACPVERAASLPRAKEAADAASARRDRYAFDAQDGIQAVELYAVAAACFSAAGQDAEAERARTSGQQLLDRIQEDYRTRRLGLQRALEYRRTRQALVETRGLLALVSHLDDPYTAWLRSLERHLRLKTETRR
jgi:hypothetical protein